LCIFLYQEHIHNFAASIRSDLVEVVAGTTRGSKKLFGCGTLGDYLITIGIWMLDVMFKPGEQHLVCFIFSKD